MGFGQLFGQTIKKSKPTTLKNHNEEKTIDFFLLFLPTSLFFILHINVSVRRFSDFQIFRMIFVSLFKTHKCCAQYLQLTRLAIRSQSPGYLFFQKKMNNNCDTK